MFYTQVQMVVFSEHAQDVLMSYAHDYYVVGTGHAQWWVYCVHTNYVY